MDDVNLEIGDIFLGNIKNVCHLFALHQMSSVQVPPGMDHLAHWYQIQPTLQDR